MMLTRKGSAATVTGIPTQLKKFNLLISWRERHANNKFEIKINRVT